MALSPDQIKFIKARVKEFGTLERAKNFYSSDSKVSVYARRYAKKIYGDRRPKLKF